MNSTTTDWIRTSMNAAVPLKQADSICLDLETSYSRAQSISQLQTTETCPSSLRQKGQNVAAVLCEQPHITVDDDTHLRRLGAQTIARFLVCMFVTELKVAKCERCLMRNSRVL